MADLRQCERSACRTRLFIPIYGSLHGLVRDILVRTMLEGLVSFFPEEDSTGIGAIRTTKELRRELAKMSQEWRCDVCGKVMSEIWQDNESKRKDIEEEEKCRKESIDLGRERDEKGEIDVASRKVSEEVIRKTSDIPEHTNKIHPIPHLEERKHNEPILPDPEMKQIFTSSPQFQDSQNAQYFDESINTSDQNSNPPSDPVHPPIPEIPAFKASSPDPLSDEKYSHLPSVSEVRAFQKSASRHILGLDIVIAVLFLVWAYVRYFLI